MITTKFNMDEISTLLETLDYLIREESKLPELLNNHDFKNKVYSLRKGGQVLYGKA